LPAPEVAGRKTVHAATIVIAKPAAEPIRGLAMTRISAGRNAR